MSWLARSIANSLKLDDYEEDEENSTKNNQIHNENKSPDDQSPSTTPRRVKEDLSELTKTLSRQFWGVASFLAPPPDQNEQRQPSDQDDASNVDLIKGIRSDFAEIGGKFKSGFSKISNNIGVSEFTKIATNFLQIGPEGDVSAEYLIGNVVGVTDEVVAFARDIAMHPETWFDFPVLDDENFEDFDMSDAQQEHALAVERLAPRLADLRLEFCPQIMSEGCFWKIYFVLVHPRLTKDDAELLSTPQIVEARAALSHELQSGTRAKPNVEGPEPNKNADLPHEESLSVPSRVESELMPPKTSDVEVVPPTVSGGTSRKETISSDVVAESGTDKHPVQSTEIQIIDKSVVEEEPVSKIKNQAVSSVSSSKAVEEKFQDDGDDWLKEESSEMANASGTTVPIVDDEDVSFSDLEDDDDVDVPISYKTVTASSHSTTNDSRDGSSVKDVEPVSIKHAGSDQVRARNSVSEESNDWLDVDDIDAM